MYKKPTGRRVFKLKSLDAEMEGLAPQRVSHCLAFICLHLRDFACAHAREASVLLCLSFQR